MVDKKNQPLSDGEDPVVVKKNFLRLLEAYQAAGPEPESKQAAIAKVLREIKQEAAKN